MKVNSITNINTNYNKPSFKHVAVPYPEYEYAYYNETSFIDKVSEFFSPKVTKEANAIKKQISQTCNASLKSPKKAVLSVLA